MAYYPLDDKKGYEATIAEIMQIMIEDIPITGECLFRLLKNAMQYLQTGSEWHNDLFSTELHFLAEEQAFVFIPRLLEKGYSKGECEYVVQQVADWWETYQSVLLCTICYAFSLMKNKKLFENRGKITELRKSHEKGKPFNESQKKYLEAVDTALVENVSASKETVEFAAVLTGKHLEYLTAHKSNAYRIASMRKMLTEVILEAPSSVIWEIINMA